MATEHDWQQAMAEMAELRAQIAALQSQLATIRVLLREHDVLAYALFGASVGDGDQHKPLQ